MTGGYNLILIAIFAIALCSLAFRTGGFPKHFLLMSAAISAAWGYGVLTRSVNEGYFPLISGPELVMVTTTIVSVLMFVLALRTSGVASRATFMVAMAGSSWLAGVVIGVIVQPGLG